MPSATPPPERDAAHFGGTGDSPHHRDDIEDAGLAVLRQRELAGLLVARVQIDEKVGGGNVERVEVLQRDFGDAVVAEQREKIDRDPNLFGVRIARDFLALQHGSAKIAGVVSRDDAELDEGATQSEALVDLVLAERDADAGHEQALGLGRIDGERVPFQKRDIRRGVRVAVDRGEVHQGGLRAARVGERRPHALGLGNPPRCREQLGDPPAVDEVELSAADGAAAQIHASRPSLHQRYLNLLGTQLELPVALKPLRQSDDQLSAGQAAREDRARQPGKSEVAVGGDSQIPRDIGMARHLDGDHIVGVEHVVLRPRRRCDYRDERRQDS